MKNGQRNRMKRMAIAIVCVGMVGSGGLAQAMNTAKHVNHSVKRLKTGKITPVMTTMIRVPASNIIEVPLGVFDNHKKVKLPDFEIGKAEVTGALWSKVYNWAIQKGYTFQYEGTNVGTGKPVTRVSWYDVIVWTNAYSEKQGLVPVYRGEADKVLKNANWNESYQARAGKYNGYQLPTMEQSEIAARFLGTTKPTKGALATEAKRTKGKGNKYYYWTPADYASGAIGNVMNNSETRKVAWFDQKTEQTVCTKSSNFLKICDMSGNVAEWGWRTEANPSYDREVPVFGGGGSTDRSFLTVSNVYDHFASSRYAGVGFRVARNVK